MKSLFALSIAGLLTILPAANSFAQSTLAYSTARISIVSAAPQVQTLEEETSEEKEQTKEQDKAEKEAPIPSKHEMDVEVRDDQIPADRGMYINYKLDDEHALMTYFAESDVHALTQEQIYNTIDVLFVREDGTIVQIVPEISLTDMEDDITYEKPIRAFIFLQAGLAGAWGLQPGDHVVHGLFSPKPKIQKVKEEPEA